MSMKKHRVILQNEDLPPQVLSNKVVKKIVKVRLLVVVEAALNSECI